VLRRAYRFLTSKTRAEIEAAADPYFAALGYRRQADEEGTFVFRRGRRLASLYSPQLRSCFASLRVKVTGEAAEGSRVVHVTHEVQTRGRLVLAEDAGLLDAESRGLQRFLERGEADAAELLEAATRDLHRAARWKLALALLAAALIATCLLAYIAWTTS